MRAGLYTPRYQLPLVDPNLAQNYLAREANPLQVPPFNYKHWQSGDFRLSLQRNAAATLPQKPLWIRAGAERIDHAVDDTQKALGDASQNLFEGAAFFVNVSPAPEKPFGFFAKTFLLKRLAGASFEMREVSSQAEPTAAEMLQLALQYLIVTRSGTQVDKVSVLTASEADLQAKANSFKHKITNFVSTDKTEAVRKLLPEAEKKLLAAEQLLLNQPPRTHADDPAIPETVPVSALPNSPYKWFVVNNLLAQGISDFSLIPEDFKGLTAVQKQVIAAHRKGEEFVSIDSEGLKKVFAERRGETHYLDFETDVQILPDGTRVDVPVQFSNHVTDAQGNVIEHAQFLHDGSGDVRVRFAKALVEAFKHHGADGKIVVYYDAFEGGRIRETAAYLRELAKNPPQKSLWERFSGYFRHTEETDYNALADAIESLIPRFQDQLAYLKKFVTHSGFKGSYKLKTTHPVLVKNPEKRYENLLIQNGEQAAIAIAELYNPATSAERKTELTAALYEYCGLDTFAMVEIDRELRKLAGI